MTLHQPQVQTSAATSTMNVRPCSAVSHAGGATRRKTWPTSLDCTVARPEVHICRMQIMQNSQSSVEEMWKQVCSRADKSQRQKRTWKRCCSCSQQHQAHLNTVTYTANTCASQRTEKGSWVIDSVNLKPLLNLRKPGISWRSTLINLSTMTRQSHNKEKSHLRPKKKKK